MKKIMLLIMLILLTTSGCCSDKTVVEVEETTIPKETTVSIPNNKEHEYDPDPMTRLDINFNNEEAVNELEYDNIVVEMEKNQYSLSDDEVKCIVTNRNKGLAIFVYKKPGVEYYSDGKWNRLEYTNGTKNFYDRYIFYFTKDPEYNVSTEVIFYPKLLTEVYRTGRYRLIVFVGPNKYYAEFDVVE